MKIILIDGNNVIHKSERFKKIFKADKENARNSFVEKVKSHFSRSYKVEFYFDGYGERKSAGIYFSGNKTADELIRDRIEKSSDNRKLTVISSDKGITDLAKVCGCSVISSDKFAVELEGNTHLFKNKNINHLLNTDNEKPNSVSKKEIDFFREKFS